MVSDTESPTPISTQGLDLSANKKKSTRTPTRRRIPRTRMRRSRRSGPETAPTRDGGVSGRAPGMVSVIEFSDRSKIRDPLSVLMVRPEPERWPRPPRAHLGRWESWCMQRRAVFGDEEWCAICNGSTVSHTHQKVKNSVANGDGTYKQIISLIFGIQHGGRTVVEVVKIGGWQPRLPGSFRVLMICRKWQERPCYRRMTVPQQNSHFRVEGQKPPTVSGAERSQVEGGA
ncbi:hypothetical protein QBC40DRAFT_352254 [Triangularia verruculosa]|uniref:Uncharacterized protein n=1 Tax=Triangularia verruculosa TaxID=2587418 RepID=A0AAN6X8T1_9PEZI|nr:hypothetical protein QBC40DRAFT_352254 [Triangularia verruculosa]